MSFKLNLDINLDLKSLWSSTASVTTSDGSSNITTDTSTTKVEENFADLKAQPWYTTLLSDPNIHEIPFTSRNITPDRTLDSLFNRTLNTGDGLRACQAFQRRIQVSSVPNTASSNAGTENNKYVVSKSGVSLEALLVASLGSDVNGHSGLAHGGFIATLLDEGTALAAHQVLPRAIMTARLTIEYKRALGTPSVVLVRSGVVKWEGRKAWVEGMMEDGEGNTYATAECLFIMVKEQNESKI